MCHIKAVLRAIEFRLITLNYSHEVVRLPRCKVSAASPWLLTRQPTQSWLLVHKLPVFSLPNELLEDSFLCVFLMALVFAR